MSHQNHTPNSSSTPSTPLYPLPLSPTDDVEHEYDDDNIDFGAVQDWISQWFSMFNDNPALMPPDSVEQLTLGLMEEFNMSPDSAVAIVEGIFAILAGGEGENESENESENGKFSSHFENFQGENEFSSDFENFEGEDDGDNIFIPYQYGESDEDDDDDVLIEMMQQDESGEQDYYFDYSE